MHFVLVGFSAIRFIHQSEPSQRLCCKSPRISSMLSLAVLRVPSSAGREGERGGGRERNTGREGERDMRREGLWESRTQGGREIAT